MADRDVLTADVRPEYGYARRTWIEYSERAFKHVWTAFGNPLRVKLSDVNLARRTPTESLLIYRDGLHAYLLTVRSGSDKYTAYLITRDTGPIDRWK
jgi:hypothetical protein